MPARSEDQRKAAGAALAAKRGERSTSSLWGPSEAMLSMTEEQLRDFARKPGGNPHPKPRTTTEAAGKHPEAKWDDHNSPTKSAEAVTTTQVVGGMPPYRRERR